MSDFSDDARKRFPIRVQIRDDLLFWLSGSEGFAVDVDDRLLPQVDPVDELLVAILLLDRLQALVEPLQGRLAGAETGESGQLKQSSFF